MFAHHYGYTFDPIEALIFSDSQPFIRQYVEDFNKMKEMGGAYRAIGKLFINSIYGRFGFRKTDEVTVLIKKEKRLIM